MPNEITAGKRKNRMIHVCNLEEAISSIDETVTKLSSFKDCNLISIEEYRELELNAKEVVDMLYKIIDEI